MGQKSEAESWLEFDLREITGRWVSPEGAPSVRIYRTRTEGYLLEFTYNNPQAVFRSGSCAGYGTSTCSGVSGWPMTPGVTCCCFLPTANINGRWSNPVEGLLPFPPKY